MIEKRSAKSSVAKAAADEESSARLAITKNFPALLSAAVAFTAVLISGTNVWVAYIAKNKDLDIATRKELREYVTDNRDVIFGNDPAAAQQIRNVMQMTFPDELLKGLFADIAIKAPPKTSDVFAGNQIAGRTFRGRTATWGGPNDAGLTPDEGLALILPSELSRFSEYFLPAQPPGTTGLARRLNPDSYYMSARWDFSVTSKEFLKTNLVLVRNPKNGKSARALPVDWGPPARTGRAAEISPGLANYLDVITNEEIEFEIPQAPNRNP
jgi:hypothetical protein